MGHLDIWWDRNKITVLLNLREEKRLFIIQYCIYAMKEIDCVWVILEGRLHPLNT